MKTEKEYFEELEKQAEQRKAKKPKKVAVKETYEEAWRHIAKSLERQIVNHKIEEFKKACAHDSGDNAWSPRRNK